MEVLPLFIEHSGCGTGQGPRRPPRVDETCHPAIRVPFADERSGGVCNRSSSTCPVRTIVVPGGRHSRPNLPRSTTTNVAIVKRPSAWGGGLSRTRSEFSPKPAGRARAQARVRNHRAYPWRDRTRASEPVHSFESPIGSVRVSRQSWCLNGTDLSPPEVKQIN